VDIGNLQELGERAGERADVLVRCRTVRRAELPGLARASQRRGPRSTSRRRGVDGLPSRARGDPRPPVVCRDQTRGQRPLGAPIPLRERYSDAKQRDELEVRSSLLGTGARPAGTRVNPICLQVSTRFLVVMTATAAAAIGEPLRRARIQHPDRTPSAAGSMTLQGRPIVESRSGGSLEGRGLVRVVA
jgi:hypothetical protein